MKEPWMTHAFIYYGKVTAWIFVPVIVVMVLGKYTAITDTPIRLISLIVICFAVTIFGIYRSIASYKDTLK